MAKTEILRVLVGSHAHGLARPDSDIDHRGVYITPASELLALGPKASQVSWKEGETEDNVSYELGHFLFLATKSNPSILEIFKGPEQFVNPKYDPRPLFDAVWSSKGVYDSHRGYGYNQRKKLFDDPHGERARKYACAWLRTLYNATILLEEGDFSMNVVGTEIESTLRDWRGNWVSTKMRDVVSECMEWEQVLQEAYSKNPDKQTDFEKVNDFLIATRLISFWSVE